MKREFVLPERPAGFLTQSVRGPGMANVVSREFTSSEDGSAFISRLEGMQQAVFRHIPDYPSPSVISHMLVVIRHDLTATAYINVLEKSASIRSKRTKAAGSVVYLDDILDIDRVELGVDCPVDAAIVYVDSFGWRRSLFYDLTPLQAPTPVPRDYDLSRALGAQAADLMFQEYFRIEDPVWTELFCQGWFPFRHLPLRFLREMLSHAREGWDIGEVVQKPEALEAIDASLREALSILDHPWFSEHRELIGHAASRFLERDYKSAVALTYPRIEGILSNIQTEVSRGQPTQAELQRREESHNGCFQIEGVHRSHAMRDCVARDMSGRLRRSPLAKDHVLKVLSEACGKKQV